MNGTTNEAWNNKLKLVYMASPYTSDKESENERHGSVMGIVSELSEQMSQRLCDGHPDWECDENCPKFTPAVIYSPILHNHDIAIAHNKGVSFVTWQDHNLTILSRCDELWVLQLTGWDNSIGVRAEIRFAHSRGLPIKFIDPLSHFPIIPIENAGIVSAITNTKVTT